MVTSQTPVRFSLLGGGTDLPAFWKKYRPSEFVSLTIGKKITVNAVDSSTRPIKVSYPGDTELVERYSELQQPHIRETMAELRQYYEFSLEPSHLKVLSDLPASGCGLGTSSALIVGLLRACGCEDKRELLELSTRIEIERLSQPIGWQDQIAAIYGGFRHYIISTNGLVTSYCLSDYGDWFCSHLMAFPVIENGEHVTRPRGHSVLKSMTNDMESRVEYFYKTLDYIPMLIEAIQSEKIGFVAQVMKLGWDLKKEHHGVHDTQIDRIYESGIRAGALAGKMSGSMSSGVGTMFFIVQPEFRRSVAKSMIENYGLSQMHVCFEPEGVRFYG